MTRRNYEALVRRNASRCETAKSKTCECRCGGALHGAAHSEQWIKHVAAALAERDERERERVQPDMLGSAEVES